MCILMHYLRHYKNTIKLIFQKIIDYNASLVQDVKISGFEWYVFTL